MRLIIGGQARGMRIISGNSGANILVHPFGGGSEFGMVVDFVWEYYDGIGTVTDRKVFGVIYH